MAVVSELLVVKKKMMLIEDAGQEVPSCDHHQDSLDPAQSSHDDPCNKQLCYY